MKLNLFSRSKRAGKFGRTVNRRSLLPTATRSRRAICEPLEVRNLLSANPITRYDFMVAGDTPMMEMSAGIDSSQLSGGAVAAGDLNVADHEQARIRLEVTDLAGNPLTVVPIGESFLLRGLVTDIRDTPQGAFQAFLDVTYETGLASVQGPISFGDDFPNGREGDATTDGAIEEVGGVGEFTPPGGGDLLVFSVQFTADSNGVLNFGANPADGPGHTVLLHGIDDPIPNDQVEFVGTSVQLGTTPMLSVNNPSQDEGTSAGENSLTFIVSLSEASDEQVTVDFATADGTAIAGMDYVGRADSLTFAPGQTSKTVTVRIFGDDRDDDDKTLFLNLSNPTGAEIAVGQGTGTILDDDDSPTLSIADVTMNEGTSTTPTDFVFTVTLSEASDRTVTVDFATGDDSAIAPDDYQAASGTLTFMPGETEKLITIPVVADDVAESNETFFVSLLNPTNATVDVGLAAGNITNDDATLATLEIGNVTVNEGDGTATLTVNVVGDFDSDIMVDFATSDDTAVAGEDYTANSGTLTIPVGQTSRTITVMLTDDMLDEDDEAFLVTLSNPVNAVIGDPEAVVTIIDNDDPPVLTFQNMDVDIPEGDSGTTNANFVVVLSAPSGKRVTFQFVVSGVTATVDEDFTVPASLMGVIEPGETQTTISIPVIGDTLVEGDETFVVELMQPVNATLGAESIAFGDIIDDDLADPTLSINDVTVDEGDSGFVNATFTVTLSRALASDVTFDFSTEDGTATAGTDYQASSGSGLTIAAGSTTREITISVIGDLTQETNETFRVVLSSVMGVAVEKGTGTGTIRDDDAPPTIAINNVQVTEGDGVDVNAVFTVTLSQASTQTITVNFDAVSDTATLNNDFRPTSGTLTFNPGETSKPISVPVVGDFQVEGTETFFVNLSNPTNATLADGQGVGTIIDDDEEGEFDPASVSGVVWVDVNGDGQRLATEQGLAGVTIHLRGMDDFNNPVDLSTTTAADGSYSFAGLVAGQYVVTQVQPTQFTDGADNVGSLGGTAAFDEFFLELEAGENGVNYDFGERGLRPEFIGRHLFFIP